MQPLTLVRDVHCRASRAEVWGHVADTLRLNRNSGASTLRVTANDTRGLERFRLRGRLGGFDVTYLEQPFAWERETFFSFYRSFLNGPITALATRYDLATSSDGTGCDVSVRVDITPRFWFLSPVVWLSTWRTLKAIASYIAAVDDAQAAVTVTPADAEALQLARSRLGPRHASELVERLVDHLRMSDDLEVSAIRPFTLARQWGVDRVSLLRLCLEAVPAGLLELRWGLLCPSCRSANQVIPSLRDLDGKGHCHACDLRYDTDLDRAVEAQFFPHPAVRRVESRPYCIGGPALTPHVLSQLPLELDGVGVVHAPPDAGRARLFARGGATAVVDIVDGASEKVTVEIHASRIEPAQMSLAPGGVLQIVNRAGEACHVKLEQTEWLMDAATAHHVATMPEFRALFGAEALRPGLALKVSHVAVLFSDLCGSTALYSRMGDAAAFGLVSDCLAYGAGVVERHGGTVVKTIGDAIMAAFVDSDDAVAAGIEMLEGWASFVSAHPSATALELKVGVNDGPCTVVTANGIIDYFGQTVNSAARVQHLAGPREAVIARGLLEAVPERTTMERIESFEATVKGIDRPLCLVRLRCV